PGMRKPEGFGQEYAFPNNAASLSSQELGTMQLKLRGFHTYASHVLGREEALLDTLQSTYDISLGIRMHELEQETGKKVLKEVLIALAVKSDDKLDRVYKTLLS